MTDPPRPEQQPTPSDLHREARRLEQVRRLRLVQPFQHDVARAERLRVHVTHDIDPDPPEAA